jgi:hypothetical protein
VTNESNDRIKMIHQVWRLSEGNAAENLGFVFTDDGLLLGSTALIERCDGRFVVRERSEIERLLSCAYGKNFSASGLMPGFATVAAALNANDQALARIAAVHLRVPDLPDRASRDAMQVMDVLIKFAGDWNPELHPRAGAPPNPGWFAPTRGSGDQSAPTRTAQSDDPTHRPDATSNTGQDWVRLRPGPKRIDELSDFAEWFANATAEDEKAIRAEIKRYYGMSVGTLRLTTSTPNSTSYSGPVSPARFDYGFSAASISTPASIQPNTSERATSLTLRC